jgi:predicted RNA-binding Zn-ribbon protein involved in translation (DUF1610 family)
MQKDQALRQALSIVSSTPRSANALGAEAQFPRFTVMAVLCHGVTIEPGRGSFDLAVRLSTLRPRECITIPTRKTRVLNKWLLMPGARIVRSCALSEKAIVVWVEFSEPETPTLSANCHQRGKQRARIARDHYINRAVKQLPWHRLSAIGVEDLNGLKRCKSQTRGKNIRKAAAPWTYGRVRQQIECLAPENRVLPIAVDPRGTSRTCPTCGKDDRCNRKGEVFRCIACDHAGDADFVGARNHLDQDPCGTMACTVPEPGMSAINEMFPDGQ